MSNNPIIRLLKVFIAFVLLICTSVIAYTVFNALTANSSLAGNFQANYTSVATNYTTRYIIAFIGIMLVGSVIYLLVGGKPRRPEQEYNNNRYLGGNPYE